MATQTNHPAIRESPAQTESVLAAKAELNKPVDDFGTTSELVASRDLWDEAYELLRGANSKLAEHYEESIMRMGQEHSRLAPIGSLARQEQLSTVITTRLDSIEKDRRSFTVADKRVVLHEQLDTFVRIVIFAKDFVSSAVGAEPHAALAWAGVCVLLPVSIDNSLEFYSVGFHHVKGLPWLHSKATELRGATTIICCLRSIDWTE